jgi:hypothetical protein
MLIAVTFAEALRDTGFSGCLKTAEIECCVEGSPEGREEGEEWELKLTVGAFRITWDGMINRLVLFVRERLLGTVQGIGESALFGSGKKVVDSDI